MSDRITQSNYDAIYSIGDEVRATMDIWAEADEHSPASCYANKGDVLIVRAIDLAYPVNVSHKDRTDCSFGVELNEIEKGQDTDG